MKIFPTSVPARCPRSRRWRGSSRRSTRRRRWSSPPRACRRPCRRSAARRRRRRALSGSRTMRPGADREPEPREQVRPGVYAGMLTAGADRATRPARTARRGRRAPAWACAANVRPGVAQQVVAARSRPAGTSPSGSGPRSRGQQGERLAASSRVHVTRAERRPPAPDRHERDIERRRGRASRRTPRCRRRSTRAARRLDARSRSRRRRARRQRPAAAVVHGGHDRTRTPRDLGSSPGADLVHVARPSGAARARSRAGARTGAPSSRAATAGRGGRGAGARAGPRRRGPDARPAAAWRRRCTTRERSSGSVIRRAPAGLDQARSRARAT